MAHKPNKYMLCLALIFQPFLDNIDLFSPILTINIHTSGSTKAIVFVFHTSHFHVCLKIFILWILVPLFRLFLVLRRWTPPARGHQNHDWNGNPRDPFPAIHLQQRHHGIFIVTSFLKMKEEADKDFGN